MIVRTIEKWEDLDSVEIIYKSIRAWECEAGEDFIDQNESIVKPVPFATFLLGRRYITKDILNSLLQEDGTLQDLLGGYDDDFNIFPNGRHDDECVCKKYHLLAEYIFQIDSLRKRLFNVLKNWGYDGEDREENELEYGIVEITFDDEDFKDTEEDFWTLHDEWLWVSNYSVQEVNEMVSSRD